LIGFAGMVLIALVSASGCGREPGPVVVYTAQDRLFAEPILRAFTKESGIPVRAVHDNEATKTTGLANRLLAEAARPQGDVWWSNEEMRTRHLVRSGVLQPAWKAFGQRQRVLVVNRDALARLPGEFTLSVLTNEAFRGRIAMAYPVFGTTATHLLVLRQRWGEAAWQAWCRALAANRPLIVDGNSVVVRLVGQGEVWIGLTDSDDVAFGRREGLPVVSRPLPREEGLAIPNTVAIVSNAPHPDAAGRLVGFLAGPEVSRILTETGALDPGPLTEGPRPTEAQWDRVLDELDPAIRWLESAFAR
jgi:iron(III) transport system substrate-binding protein